MGKGWFGYTINVIAVLLIIFFNVMFCFPYALPVEVGAMNYNSVILTGVAALTAFWWLVHGARKYPGPKIAGVAGHVEVGPDGVRRLSAA